MRTSREVYNQIKWDSSLEPDEFTIVYADREQGLLEIPFAIFAPDGDIPWHRIEAFRRSGVLVWDRATGVDYLHPTMKG